MPEDGKKTIIGISHYTAATHQCIVNTIKILNEHSAKLKLINNNYRTNFYIQINVTNL